MFKNLTQFKGFNQVQDEQYAAALAKPVEKRNFTDRSAIKLGNRRHGMADEFTPAGADTKVIEYTDAKEMQKGIKSMAMKGYSVVGQSAYTPKKGAFRVITGGALFRNTTPRTTVTFSRQAE